MCFEIFLLKHSLNVCPLELKVRENPGLIYAGFVFWLEDVLSKTHFVEKGVGVQGSQNGLRFRFTFELSPDKHKPKDWAIEP